MIGRPPSGSEHDLEAPMQWTIAGALVTQWYGRSVANHGSNLECRVKQKDFSPRRIYLTVVAIGGVVLALVVVAIWGLIKAAQSLPWTG